MILLKNSVPMQLHHCLEIYCPYTYIKYSTNYLNKSNIIFHILFHKKYKIYVLNILDARGHKTKP